MSSQADRDRIEASEIARYHPTCNSQVTCLQPFRRPPLKTPVGQHTGGGFFENLSVNDLHGGVEFLVTFESKSNARRALRKLRKRAFRQGVDPDCLSYMYTMRPTGAVEGPPGETREWGTMNSLRG